MLTGSDLLAKFKEVEGLSESEQCRACGYVSTKKNGEPRLNFTAYYKALLEAKSSQLDQAKKKARKTAVKAMGGGMMKKKGMAKGGAMKKKGYAKGGAVKKMRGGMMKKKGYAKGGSVARGSGAARPQRFTRNG